MTIKTAKKLVKILKWIQIIFMLCLVLAIVAVVILLFITQTLPMCIFSGFITIVICMTCFESWLEDVKNLADKPEEPETKL